MIAFIKIIRHHQNLVNQRDFHKRLIDINQAELKYLEHNQTDRHQGLEYLEESHPYAADLDLFGDRSLFQLVERCQTKIGKNKLVVRLLSPLGIKEISDNQEAIGELSDMVAWRQTFYAQTDDLADTALEKPVVKKINREEVVGI